MINTKWSLIVSCSAILTAGCAGNLYTYTDTDLACVENKAEACIEQYEGVMYRPLVKYEEHFILDRILNGKGEVTHFASSKSEESGCVPVSITEVKLIPDPDNEYLVQYAPAFFETSTFSVKLSPQGTLSEVGTSSTPGGKSLVESFTGLATTIKTLNHGALESSTFTEEQGKPLCSHGRVPIPAS